MKKLLYLSAVLLLATSCSGGNSDKAKEDSAALEDSLAKVEIAKEQARLDSILQDSIAKAEQQAKAASQYDEVVDQYVANVNKVAAAAKKGDYSKYGPLSSKCINLSSKIEKIKGELTPEQLDKYKKAKSKYSRLLSGTIAA